MWSVALRFESSTALLAALSGSARELLLPGSPTVAEGEWVLATFELGARRRTAAAGCGSTRDGRTFLVFTDHDWDRLRRFASNDPGSATLRAARQSPWKEGAQRASSLPPPPFENHVPPSSSLRPVGARVCLLDPEEASRRDLAEGLCSQGLVVDAFATSEEALAALSRPSALVVSWNLPGDGARAFTRRMRAVAEQGNALPVLFVATSRCSRAVVLAHACGAADFLVRPFRLTELGARLFGLLGRARAETRLSPAS